MNKFLWLILLPLLFPICLLIRVAFLKTKLSSWHWLAIGVLFIPIFTLTWIDRYILIKVPSVRDDLGETVSWFTENWYFIYFDVAMFIGLIALFLYKRHKGH